jgi:hypothetical protein
MVWDDKEEDELRTVNSEQRFGLPADVVDDVEANQCGEDESDGNGGSVYIEGQLAVWKRLVAV